MMMRFVCTGVLAVLIVLGVGTVPAQAHNINALRGSRGASGHTVSDQSMRLQGGCGAYYTVRSGDTLSLIARRCGVSVAGLKRANGLRSDRIVIGQALAIPGATAASRKRTVPAAPVPAATPRAGAEALPTPTPALESTVSPW
jgi:LysM repeat protein